MGGSVQQAAVNTAFADSGHSHLCDGAVDGYDYDEIKLESMISRARTWQP